MKDLARQPRDEKIDQFLLACGWGGSTRANLAGDASFRRYERITRNGNTAVLMDAPPEHENVGPFLLVAEALLAQDQSAPNILARDETAGLLLLEDLGDDCFTRILSHAPQREKEMYEAATMLLVEWHRQFQPKTRLPIYDEHLLMSEISLFSDWYLPAVAGKEAAQALRAEYLDLWRNLLTPAVDANRYFVHRDYHADNLLWLPQRQGTSRIGLLDFQDAVLGGDAYDLVSFLEDARRDVQTQTVQECIEIFVRETGVNKTDFLARYALLGAQRNSKIIGIFTRLAMRDGKPHYLKYLPRVWKHLEHDIQHEALLQLRIWMDNHIPAAWRGIIVPPAP